MPLLSPSQIHSVLKPELKRDPKNNDKISLSSLLENANLTPEEILENLSSLMRSAESDSTKLKAAEVGLKLNGLLTGDDARPDFSVTIVINDGEYTSLTNPILIPRQ